MNLLKVAALVAAGVSRYANPVPRSRYGAGFDESKHPRGNKNNPGQFAKKGEASGKASEATKSAPHSAGTHAAATHANNYAQQGDSEQAAKFHDQAAKAHQQLAEQNPQHAAAHNAAAKAHTDAAALHRQPVEQLVEEQQKEDTTSPPPGGYNPDPAQGKAARVGVPGDVVPPPPKKIPRLNNLTPEERAVESKFAEMFEKDPDGLADQFIAGMANRSIGDGPNIFATDESKMLFPEWKGTKVPVMENGQPKIGKDGKPEMELSPETKAFRSKYNTAMHQTANAIAKRAFLRYLDTEVAKSPNKSILVTAGGVAAGKGYAIDNVNDVKSISNKASATWDSAGEQNSTELEWLASECKKRGIKMTAVFVHSNPTETWENPDRGVIERAGKKGRMVDARPFADSYTHGARNFHNFQQAHQHDDSIQTMVLDNTRPPIPDLDENGVQKLDKKGKPAMKADIQYLPQIPQEMLSMSPEHLYARCMDALAKAPAPEAVKEGGSAGARIWGPPQGAAQKPGQNPGK